MSDLTSGEAPTCAKVPCRHRALFRCPACGLDACFRHARYHGTYLYRPVCLYCDTALDSAPQPAPRKEDP